MTLKCLESLMYENKYNLQSKHTKDTRKTTTNAASLQVYPNLNGLDKYASVYFVRLVSGIHGVKL